MRVRRAAGFRLHPPAANTKSVGPSSPLLRAINTVLSASSGRKSNPTGVSAAALARAAGVMRPDGWDQVMPAVELELKYTGYVARERERAERIREQRNFKLDHELPYQAFVTLSSEAREKLGRMRPGNLAPAGRIPGVSPADLQNLVMEVRRLGEGAPGRPGRGGVRLEGR